MGGEIGYVSGGMKKNAPIRETSIINRRGWSDDENKPSLGRPAKVSVVRLQWVQFTFLRKNKKRGRIQYSTWVVSDSYFGGLKFLSRMNATYGLLVTIALRET